MYDTRAGLQLAYPRSRDTIRRDAYLLRSKLGLTNKLYFPILPFLENVLPQIDPSFNMEIFEDCDLPGIFAEYIPSINVIRVKRSVYEAAAFADLVIVALNDPTVYPLGIGQFRRQDYPCGY